MPYHGLSSFLHSKTVRSLRDAYVSMPYHGLSSFLQRTVLQKFIFITVSMPYHGLSSFLHIGQSLIDNSDMFCFNALPRAFFFSTANEIKKFAELLFFSMPYHGLSSFLLLDKILCSTCYGECFNALPRAFFFSTRKFQETLKFEFGFNALPRAFFFSTSFVVDYDYNYKAFQCPTTGFLLFYC